MKKITYIVALLLITCSPSFAQKAKDCRKLYTGEFELSLSDGQLFSVYRNDTLQIETVGGESKRYDVQWIDDCTYKLIPRFVLTIPVEDEEVTINEIKFEIIEVKAHSYTTMAHVNILGKNEFVVSTLYEKGYGQK